MRGMVVGEGGRSSGVLLYWNKKILPAVFDFAQKNVRLATFGPPGIWQDHQISRAGGPMVHCLDM